MITGIIVISIVWLFVSVGVATLHSDWVNNMYCDDSIESYLDRAKLAFLAPPLYVVSTIAFWRYKKNQQLDNCKECLYRMMAEKEDIPKMPGKDKEN